MLPIPYDDPNWSTFSENDQGEIVWLYSKWSLQVRQDSGVSGGIADLASLASGGVGLLIAGMANGDKSTFGGSGFSAIIQHFQTNPKSWGLVGVHAEPSISNKGGLSIQEVYKNQETGDYIVRHILIDELGNEIDSHFRPYGK